MVYVFIRQQVADFDRWIASFEGNATWRMGVGEQNFRVYRDADDPTFVTLVQGWADFATAQIYLSSDELRRKMQDAGVIGEPTIYVMEELKSGQL